MRYLHETFLKREDFNNDTIDAGDIGAGKRVTVLYELLLQGEKAVSTPCVTKPTRASPCLLPLRHT